MKITFTLLLLVCATAMGFVSTNNHKAKKSKLYNNPNCPLSYTLAPNASTGLTRTCNSSLCHDNFATNVGSGSVVLTGIPATYTAGAIYPITVRVTGPAANRLLWGFAVKAVNADAGANLNWVNRAGTFSPGSNANSSLKGAIGSTVTSQTQELSHATAASTSPGSTYTFSGMTWTAPTTSAPTSIKFYVAGNAADGSGDESGDYIYTANISTTKGVLPIKLTSFTASADSKGQNVLLDWKIEMEVNAASYEIEASTDGITFQKINSVKIITPSYSPKSYQYIDNKHLGAVNGPVYYRLKMVDLDGSFEYSSISKATLLNTKPFIVKLLSANPVLKSDPLHYQVYSTTNTVLSVKIVDLKGAELYASKIALTKATNDIKIPLSFIKNTAAVFILMETTEGARSSFTQLIQN